MDRYLQRTMCRSCSMRDRDGTAVPAFYGLGTEQPRRAEQAGPDPKGSRQCSHPPPTLPRNHRSFQSTPKFQLRVSLYPSQLGQHVFVQSKRHHMPRKSPEKGLYFWPCLVLNGRFPPIEKKVYSVISEVASSPNFPRYSPFCLKTPPWAFSPLLFLGHGEVWGSVCRRGQAVQPLSLKRSRTSKGWEYF